MKSILLLFLLMPVLLSAQTYFPLISTSDSSDTWVDVNSCQDFSCYYTFKNRYHIDGDTLINGHQYARIYKTTHEHHGSVSSQWCSVTDYFYPSIYFCAIREEGKRVYAFFDGSVSEHLAYDFNLTVGDTVPNPVNYSEPDPSDRIIVSIDSISVSGNYHKRFKLSGPGPIRYIIEGIGASTGVFFPVGSYNGSLCGFSISCYAEYGMSDYFTDCEFLSAGTEELLLENKPVELIRITDFLGRDAEDQINTFLIYRYSDGTIKKVYKTE